MRRVAAAADIEVNTHQLRHTFGAEPNDTTSDLCLVQEFMRHTKVTHHPALHEGHIVPYDRGVMSVGYG